MPTLAVNKQLSIHFLPHRPRLFHLSTENVCDQSVRNGHQEAYSRADTLNISINEKIKEFSTFGKYNLKIIRSDNIHLIEFIILC